MITVFRYVVLAWNSESKSQVLAARMLQGKVRELKDPWTLVYEKPGVCILCLGHRQYLYNAIPLFGEHGIILGAIHVASSNRRVDKFCSRQTIEILSSDARSLVTSYWGNYIAIIRASEGGSLKVLRSPGGAIRCFITTIDSVTVLFSHTEDCVSMGMKFNVDWEYVIAEICGTAAMGWSRTGLREVSSLGPGECLTVLGAEQRRATYWDALSFARDPLEDHDEVLAQVRDTVIQAVRAWASREQHVLLLLSGGLDSSIALGCMRDMERRPEISCLSFYCPEKLGDERRYARAAAQHAGCELMEVERQRDINLEALLRLPQSARPSTNHTDHVMFGSVATRIAKERRAGVVLVGQLGDELFCRETSRDAVADYVFTHGMRRGSFNVATDLARISGRSALREFLAGVAYGLLTNRRSIARNQVFGFRPQQPFVEQSTLASQKHRFFEEWLHSVEDIPIGKMSQIAGLASGQAYFSEIGTADDPDWVLVFLSQPLLELMLRVPVFLHVRNGVSRALQRRAFHGLIPEEICLRRSKGSTAYQREEVLSRNRAFVRSLLLDGILARERVLDRRATETYFSKEHIKLNDRALMQCVKAEAWLRVWAA